MPVGSISAARRRSASANDPYYANVVFLAGARFEANGTGTFTEEAKSRTVTSTGSAASISTAEAKFGTGSIKVNAPGTDYYWAADNADWDFGSGAFTVECWVRFASVGGTLNYMIAQYDTGTNQRAWALLFDASAGTVRLIVSTNGTGGTNVAASWAPSTGVWYHVAADYDGSNYRTYVDGVMKGKAASIGTLFNSTARLSLGSATISNASNGSFNGYLDEVRITKGTARYASDAGFTPPTAIYPRS